MTKRSPLQTKKQSTIETVRPVVLRITREHGMSNVRIFGSFARNEVKKTSDIDLLVQIPKGTTLFDLAELQLDLEASLHRKVDIVPDNCIKPALRERILSEALAL